LDRNFKKIQGEWESLHKRLACPFGNCGVDSIVAAEVVASGVMQRRAESTVEHGDWLLILAVEDIHSKKLFLAKKRHAPT
jgi:hypothetical protein